VTFARLGALLLGVAVGLGAAHGTATPPVADASRVPAAHQGMARGLALAAGARADAPALELDDPLLPRQWYVQRTRVFDAWPVLPPLAPVRVAIIDSGVDLGHPDLAGRVVAARSFVGGSARDTQGHGTIVAGIVAARSGNGAGIAGLAPAAELIVAKVVAPDRSISVRAEARAIRWAVDQGARVINMSLGGLRDPLVPARDDFSAIEAEAIRYAVRKGVLVVAAVGNADQAPREPWGFATYPAALPHVVGVSAIGRSGGSPTFSNRDLIHNDLAAPGVEIVSTFPRALTAARDTCLEQGYTPCATDEFVDPEGTSFAAPQVTAVAANLLATMPVLRPEQVATILQRTALDATPATGCGVCGAGRDRQTGWGELDGAAALAALTETLPAPDALEPNDDAGGQAVRLYLSPRTRSRGVRATLDYWDDPDDVYAVRLRRGERLYASLSAAGADVALALWAPSTRSVGDLVRQDLRLRISRGPGAVERLAFTARSSGWTFLQLRLLAAVGPVPYRLSIVRSPVRSGST
jgi:hypothetical protein